MFSLRPPYRASKSEQDEEDGEYLLCEEEPKFRAEEHREPFLSSCLLLKIAFLLLFGAAVALTTHHFTAKSCIHGADIIDSSS